MSSGLMERQFSLRLKVVHFKPRSPGPAMTQRQTHYATATHPFSVAPFSLLFRYARFTCIVSLKDLRASGTGCSARFPDSVKAVTGSRVRFARADIR
jgi:hypothetical protein